MQLESEVGEELLFNWELSSPACMGSSSSTAAEHTRHIALVEKTSIDAQD